LVEEHRVYYEVLPYYVVVEEGHGSPAATTRRIQSGFDIDVYGARIDAPPWRSHKYQLGYEELKKLVEAPSHECNDSSFVEVIASYSNICFDSSNGFQPQAMLRIRVSHYRVVDQPAGPPEEGAVRRIEKQLQQIGIRFGKPASH
jgi:hypothetical protein